MNHILLLGATGFVGQNVQKIIANTSIKLTLSSKSLGTDLLKLDDIVSLLKRTRPQYIINCAAHVGSLNYVTQQAATIVLENSRMIMNLYEAVAQVDSSIIIINPIANCAYPANATLFTENELLNGQVHQSVLSYGSARRLLYQVSECFYMQYHLRTINLLVPNMYGPFDSTDPNKAHALNALISKFVKAEHKKEKNISIWGTGVAIREWLYAEDFGRVVQLIISKKVTKGLSEPINIAQNFGLSVRELVDIIHHHFNNQFKIIWDHKMPDGAPKKVMDDRKFKKTFLGFHFTELEEGIKETISYYKGIYPY